MRPPDEIARCLSLRDEGLNATQISSLAGIPRSTVRDWLRSTTPRRRIGNCEACGRASHAFTDLPDSYLYLLGTYLGDGCISAHRRGVYRLRITLDARYPRIVREVAGSVGAVIPCSRVLQFARRDGCIEVSSYSKAWPCLFPQHGPGKKHQRRITLEEWQQSLVTRAPRLLLRGLIHSDGCRSMNTGRGGWRAPRYSFCNLSADIRQIFVDACQLLDLRTTFARPKTIYVSRKADVARMDQFIGPKA